LIGPALADVILEFFTTGRTFQNYSHDSNRKQTIQANCEQN
jgi:hypothetical protein